MQVGLVIISATPLGTCCNIRLVPGSSFRVINFIVLKIKRIQHVYNRRVRIAFGRQSENGLWSSYHPILWLIRCRNLPWSLSCCRLCLVAVLQHKSFCQSGLYEYWSIMEATVSNYTNDALERDHQCVHVIASRLWFSIGTEVLRVLIVERVVNACEKLRLSWIYDGTELHAPLLYSSLNGDGTSYHRGSCCSIRCQGASTVP